MQQPHVLGVHRGGAWLLSAVLAAHVLHSAHAAVPPDRAAVASAHPLASQAGIEVLAQGGNAFDAAVAVSAALSVVEPYSSGLGGGAFFLLHRAADRFETMIDARETAPGAATRDMYLDVNGEPLPRASRDGPLAAGIPGLPAALAYVSVTYGRLPLAASLAPAIRYAAEGFAVDEELVARLEDRRETITRWPAAAAVFLPNGRPPAAGAPLRQGDLATTLRRLAEHGQAGFYAGRTARALTRGVRAAGGIWREQDLADYRIVERAPLVGAYRGMRIVTAAPPSSGGVAMLGMLNVLAGYELPTLTQVQRTHLLAESMRRAYRDRAVYLGDPDFVAMPLEMLLHPHYAAGQRASLRLDRATPSDLLAEAVPVLPAGDDTSHFSVLDADGNAVSVTQSINFSFGSGFMAPGTGLWLNNEMDDFSIKPGAPNGYLLLGAEANAIEPGKRMLSSMTPTLLDSDAGLALLGTPGGSRIITMVLLGTLAWVDGATATDIVGLPRLHHQYFPDQLSYEPAALSAADAEALRQLGHVLAPVARDYGNMQVVTWDHTTGGVDAASDPRGIGAPAYLPRTAAPAAAAR